MEVSTKALIDELQKAGIPLARVNTSDPEDEHFNRGRWTMHNAAMAARHLVQAATQTFRGDVAAVYVPVSQERPAFYRDAIFILLARAARKPVAVHLHGGGFCRFYENETRAMRALIRATVGSAELGIVLSERLRSALRCVLPDDRLTPVLIGVDVNVGSRAEAPERRSTEDGEVRLFFLSTLVRPKGVLVFLEAFALARRQRPQLRATLAGAWGDAAFRSEVLARIAELGIGDALDMPGPVSGDQKARLFETADVFCFPTFYDLEGTPSTVVEAMAAELPVIATAWAGIPDLVVDGETAILLDIPSPELLAEKLVLLADDRELRRRLGAAGRRRYLRHFTQRAFGERIVSALAPLVEGGRARPAESQPRARGEAAGRSAPIAADADP